VVSVGDEVGTTVGAEHAATKSRITNTQLTSCKLDLDRRLFSVGYLNLPSSGAWLYSPIPTSHSGNVRDNKS
jgi:hypothetical protein